MAKESAGRARDGCRKARRGGRLREDPRVESGKDFSDQERIFGSLLGSIPTRRAHTNGGVINKGYAVAAFDDTGWADPTYSVAKRMLSTVAALAVRDGKIRSLDKAVGQAVKDGGYDSPRNRPHSSLLHEQSPRALGSERLL